MDRITRKPFQGVTNIVRFNWHFYIIVLVLFCAGMLATLFVSPVVATVLMAGMVLMVLVTLVSLSVSYYVYDCSGLYRLHWLDMLKMENAKSIMNINAGFDETSALLADKYPGAKISAYDFYDAARHTELSIKRARKAYAPFPGTIAISTSDPSFIVGTVDCIFAILAAHEIRNTAERAAFFTTLKSSLNPGGRIVVVEHLRNLPNFLAYNIGFFHFHSKAEWKQTFSLAGLSVVEEYSFTPFICIFILS